MGTRSRIAMAERGGFRSIYCHWDGYVETPGNGSVLNKHWRDVDKLRRLMAIGSISSLGHVIGEKHDFDKHREHGAEQNWTLAYGRDRGEEDVDADFDRTLSALKKRFEDGWEEYLYVYVDGQWTYTRDGNSWSILDSKEVARCDAEAQARLDAYNAANNS